MNNQENEGWVFLVNSKKAHYFRNGRSLCKKWGYMGNTFEKDEFESPDDCKDCRRRLNKEKGAKK